MMKDTPIQILDHIFYRNEASLKTNIFKIASNDSEYMLSNNFSVCFLSSDAEKLFTALNEKTNTNEISKIDIITRLIHLSCKREVNILSCEEYKVQSIKRILDKIYDLDGQLSSDNF